MICFEGGDMQLKKQTAADPQREQAAVCQKGHDSWRITGCI